MNKDTKRKFFLWAKIIIGLLIVAYAAFFISTYRKIQNGDMVKFQGHWYTTEQLKEILPPQYAPLKPATNTTEEVYTAFREALLAGNIDEALGYIREEKKEKYKEYFYNQKTLKEYSDIPLFKDLQKEGTGQMDNFRKNYRYYKEGEEIPYNVGFEINQATTHWEITSI